MSFKVGGARRWEDIDNSTQIEMPYCDICKIHFKKMSGLISHLKEKLILRMLQKLRSSIVNPYNMMNGFVTLAFQTEESLTIHQLKKCKN